MIKIQDQIEQPLNEIGKLICRHKLMATPREVGRVIRVERGVAEIQGLPMVNASELLLFPREQLGFVFDLDESHVGCVLLDSNEELDVGDEVRRSGRMLDIPVGSSLLGQIIDPVGRALDGKPPPSSLQRYTSDREAHPIIDRAPVSKPLQTGIKVIDALVPIGRGQRQLIVGDRQTGKTAVAIDAMINQEPDDVICIYCSIGQRSSSVANVISALKQREALERCVIVVGQPDSPPGLQFIAPYAATSIGEYFMEQGQDVLIVYDELTAHARAYREMSLLLRRPPGREAFPGDIFYIHARLLERATHLKEELGGGSITALPVVETEAQNVSAYIPTNLISITDGQVYLSPQRFQQGILPAVDVGVSVSRVGGKAQLPAYRKLTGPLRLAYSQFEELEKFARFSSQLDEETSRSLNRGQRVREVLKQDIRKTLSVAEQILTFVAVTRGGYDDVPLEEVSELELQFVEHAINELPTVVNRIERGEPLAEEDLTAIEVVIRRLVEQGEVVRK